MNDTRGLEVELSNSKCIAEVLSLAKSVRIVILTSYKTITEGRGDNFRESVDTIYNYVNNISSHFGSIKYFYTHCQSITLEDIKQELEKIEIAQFTD